MAPRWRPAHPPSQARFELARRRGKPAVLRGGCRSWPIVRTWTRARLARAERETVVEARVVRGGEISGAAGEEVVTSVRFGADFLRARPLATAAESLYLAQLDARALPALDRELPRAGPGFAASASLGHGRPPRRLLWISRGAVRSRLHYDAYDNVLCVVRGRKRVRLLPPCAAARRIVTAAPASASAPNHAAAAPRWAEQRTRAAARFVTLRAGDALYIPEGWWHEVRTTGPLAIAVSYWWRTPLGSALLSLRPARSEQRAAARAPAPRPRRGDVAEGARGQRAPLRSAYVLRRAAAQLVEDEQRRALDALSRRHAPTLERSSLRDALGVGRRPPTAAAGARRARALAAAALWVAAPAELARALQGEGGEALSAWLRALPPRAAYALVTKLEREAASPERLPEPPGPPAGGSSSAGAAGGRPAPVSDAALCAVPTAKRQGREAAMPTPPSLAVTLFAEPPSWSDASACACAAGAAEGLNQVDGRDEPRAVLIARAEQYGRRVMRRLVPAALGLVPSSADV